MSSSTWLLSLCLLVSLPLLTLGQFFDPCVERLGIASGNTQTSLTSTTVTVSYTADISGFIDTLYVGDFSSTTSATIDVSLLTSNNVAVATTGVFALYGGSAQTLPITGANYYVYSGTTYKIQITVTVRRIRTLDTATAPPHHSALLHYTTTSHPESMDNAHCSTSRQTSQSTSLIGSED